MKESLVQRSRKTGITLKIVLLTAGVCLFTVFLATGYIYSVAKEAIQEAAVNELTAIRETKARQIEDYFHQLRRQVLTLSERDRTAMAMKAFGAAYDDLSAGFRPGAAEMKHVDAALAEYQQHRSLDRVQTAGNNPRHAPPLTSVAPAGRLLQYLYVLKQNNAKKAAQIETYQTVHRRFAPFFNRITDRFGFYDVFLVNHRTGIVVYTHAKEADFATSLEKGPFRDTNLAEAYQAARTADAPGFVRMVDFQLYPPSGYAPAAFIAAPVFEAGEKIGVLIVQIPIDKINTVMTAGRNWEKEGMGRTGEGFLIGRDLRIRNDPRFFMEDPSGYFALMQRRGVDAATLGLIKRHKTAILLQRLTTEATGDLFRRKKDVRRARDYRGEPGIVAHRPIRVPDMDWRIVVKMDEAETMASVNAIGWQILVVVPLLMAAGAGLCTLLCRRVLQPMGPLVDGIQRLQEGDLSVRVPSSSTDEIGTLARAFNTMAAKLQKTREHLQLSSHALEQNSTALVIVDVEGRVEQVNTAAMEMLGYTEPELIRQPFHAMVHHRHPDGSLFPENTCPVHRAHTQGKPYRIDEETLWHKDGSPIPAEFSSAPIRNQNQLLGSVVSFRDVTERKAAEKAIRQSEERIRRILETANEGFWFINNDAVAMEVNPALCKILDREASEIVGRPIMEFYDEKGLAILHKQLALREKGVESNYENSLIRPNGVRVPCLFNATPFFDERGVKKGAFAMVTDITELRRAEDAMKESEKRLKLAMKSGNIGFWDVDFLSEKSVYDEKWAQMLGYELQEIEQSRQTWLDAIHPEDRKRVLQVGREYREGRQAEYEVEYRVLTKRGDIKWFASRGSAVAWDANGTATRMVGTVRDITVRKRSEMTQARRLRSEKAMAAVSRALLGSDTEPEILRKALKQLLTAAQVDRVYVLRNIEDPELGLCMQLWLEACAPGVDSVWTGEKFSMWPYGKGFARWQAEMAAGRPVMGTVATFPESEKEILQRREVVSLLNLPVFVSGRWFGFIGFDDAFLERFWTSSDVTLLGTTAEIIGAFVERQQVQEALQESEQRIKTILHAVNTGIIIIDPENRIIVDANPVAAEMIGLAQEDIVGKICHRFICPWQEHDCPILDHQEKVDNAERILVTAQGLEIPILKTVVPVLLNGKRHLLESFVDLSQRKAAEEKLHSHLVELERFNKLTINREEKMIQLKQEINTLLNQAGRAKRYKIVE